MAGTDPHGLAASRIDQYLMERALRQKQAAGPTPGPPPVAHPVITISRVMGVPGTEIGALVAKELGFHFLDRQVLDAVAGDMRLGERILASLDEGSLSAVDSWFSGLVDYDHRLVDLHSFHHILIRVIRGVSIQGNAVILGRGANFILRGTNAFRVRLTAPLSLRAEALAAARGPGFSLCDARREIHEHAERRRRFISTHFRADIDDVEAYDAVFSLRRLDPSFAAGLILDAYRRTVGL